MTVKWVESQQISKRFLVPLILMYTHSLSCSSCKDEQSLPSDSTATTLSDTSDTKKHRKYTTKTYPRLHSTWILAHKRVCFGLFCAPHMYTWERSSSYTGKIFSIHSLCAVHCAYNYLNSYFMHEFLQSEGSKSSRRGTAELWKCSELNIKKAQWKRENKQESKIAWKRSRPATRKVRSLVLYSVLGWIHRMRRSLSPFLLHWRMCVHAHTQQIFLRSCTWRSSSRTCFAYILLILYCPKVFIQ